jgi:hypothetical protein
MQFTLTNPVSYPVTVTGLTLTNEGTGTASGIASVEVLQNGVTVASGTFTGTQALLTLSNILGPSSAVTYTVVVTYTTTATGTYQLGITSDTNLSGTSGNNGQPAQFTGAPITGADVTVCQPTSTPTPSTTATVTSTSTWTSTPVWTGTPTITFTVTVTMTPAPEGFFVDKNLFLSSQESVTIRVSLNEYPGEYSLRIYNSAGELVRNLDERSLTSPFQWVYPWDGRNDKGEMCASGVYIIYLIEPVKRRVAKVLLVR